MKIKTIVAIAFALTLLVGCSSDQEKLVEKQKQTCKTDIESGKEPTPFCTNLLPEYQSVAPINPQQYLQPTGQSSQPQSQPIVVNQPAASTQSDSSSNIIRDIAIGGLLGHAMSSGNSGQSNVAPPSTVINKTIIQRAPIAVQQASKPASSMDMSRLSQSVRSKPASSMTARMSSPTRRK
jgi:PBP1b-binding outer membrane lipoprotein LpoB